MEWILYLAWSLIATILAALIWVRQRVHGVRPFALATLFSAAWSFTRAIELLALSPLSTLLANQFRAGLLSATCVMWLVFVLQYTGHGRWLTQRNLALLFTIPAISLLLAAANGFFQYELHPASSILGRSGGGNAYSTSLVGAWYWLSNIYAFATVIASTLLLLGVLANAPTFYRIQVAILLVGLMVPSLWVCLGSPVREAESLSDFTPYLLTLSGGVIAIGVFRYRLLDILPLGREIVVRTMTDPVFVADVFHNVVDLNPAAEKLIGQSVNHVIGQQVSKVLKPWPAVVKNYFSTDGAREQELILVADKSGNSYTARLSTLTGRRGHHIGHLITFHDISQVRAAEEALRLSEARYRTLSEEQSRLIMRLQEQTNYLNTLIESSGSAIVSLDLEGRVLSWNHAAEVTYGMRKEEAIGQVLPMVPTTQHDEIIHLLASLDHTGGSMHNLEVSWQHKNAGPITVMTTLSAVHDLNDNTARILSISTDVSQEKRLEQDLLRQQRAVAILQERTRLARELHDSIGQVLSFVRMQTYTARHFLSHGWYSDVDGLLERIIEVAQNSQTELRDQILSLNVRSTADAKTPGLVSMLRSYVSDLTRDTPLRTEFSAVPELDQFRLAWDVEAQVVRIVQEAIANVRKHAGAQFLHVILKTDTENFMAVIEDDGHGFDPEAISGASERRFGLRIMAERAEEIGGHLQILSSPGRGTKVTLVIPKRVIAV